MPIIVSRSSSPAGLLSREHRHLGLSKLGQRHWQPIREFSKAVDVIGNELISTHKLRGTPLGECYQSYREMLDRFRFLTFATLISEAVAALEQPEIRERALANLRHLVVDEYQDINPAQERLIEIMAQPPVELCVVGDDDQSIYQWRGSEMRNIVEFTVRRRQAATASLDTNHRSRPAIVQTANRFAGTITGRLPKTMKPARPDATVQVVPWSADTDEEEADQLAQTIEELHALGFRYRDIAVLFRSVRTSAPPLVDALKQRGVPFSCGGRTGLFLQPEVSLLGEIFAWFVDGDWKDDRFGQPRKADLDHIVRGLTAEFGENPTLRKYLEDWRALRLRVKRTISLVEDYYDLLDRLGVKRIDTSTPAGVARLGALARFSEVLADFEHIQRRGHKACSGGAAFTAGTDRGKAYYWALHNYLLYWARDAYTILYVIGRAMPAGQRVAKAVELVGGSYILALTPPISAFLFVATSGSAVNAWLGSMGLTRQIMALEALGKRREKYLWVPGWLGMTLAYLAVVFVFGAGMVLGGAWHSYESGVDSLAHLVGGHHRPGAVPGAPAEPRALADRDLRRRHRLGRRTARDYTQGRGGGRDTGYDRVGGGLHPLGGVPGAVHCPAGVSSLGATVMKRAIVTLLTLGLLAGYSVPMALMTGTEPRAPLAVVLGPERPGWIRAKILADRAVGNI